MFPMQFLQKRFPPPAYLAPGLPQVNHHSQVNQLWPANIPNTGPLTLSLVLLTNPTQEAFSSYTAPTPNANVGPFFPGKKPFTLQYSRVRGIVLCHLTFVSPTTSLGKQKRGPPTYHELPQ